MRGTPSSYAELFDEYHSYVIGLLHKLGIDEAEDAASDILLKFYEQDFLSKFDPSLSFDTTSGKKRTSFQAFLSGFVSTYALQHRDKQITRRRKEPVHTDEPIGEAGALWIEVYAPTQPRDRRNDDVELALVLKETISHLESLPVRGKRDLPKLFRMIVDQTLQAGRPNREEIAREFGVSATAVHLMIQDLRKELSLIDFRSKLAT